MSLEVIAGPPGSGRGAIVVARFRDALGLDPVLVAPTSDDVDRLERELCATPDGVLGGTITSFPGLFGEVSRAVGVEAPPPLTPIQVMWLARQATRATRLRLLARSAAREGFAPALAGLLGELQSAGLDASAFAIAVADAEAGAYERELAALFESYERLRDGIGGIDEHGLAARATAMLRARPDAWNHRPVLLYGFDDLTREQVELVDALAAAAAVTATVTFEDRSALAARAELLAVLRDELGAAVTEVRPGTEEADPLLRHLERNLFETAPTRLPAGDSVRILEGAGERGEAEMIGRKIARLLADGIDPGEIAVAVRNPDRQAPPLARSLSRMGIPVAAEAGIPLATTATGAALDELLAIAGGEADSA
ncbi:MAG: hypothetical protein KDB46_02540, partial [Solirubrobacterales bacterium]|nr:hypothetical protein [Solirubrobacterales bacterium]